MQRVVLNSVQFGQGGCLTRLLGLFIILFMLAAIALGVVLIPIVLAVAYILNAVAGLFSPRPAAARPDPRPADHPFERLCPACGADLSHLPRMHPGVCPSCSTPIGIDAEVRHNPEDAPRLPPPPLHHQDPPER